MFHVHILELHPMSINASSWQTSPTQSGCDWFISKLKTGSELMLTRLVPSVLSDLQIYKTVLFFILKTTFFSPFMFTCGLLLCFLGMLVPPVDQWNGVKPRCLAHTVCTCKTKQNKTTQPHCEVWWCLQMWFYEVKRCCNSEYSTIQN